MEDRRRAGGQLVPAVSVLLPFRDAEPFLAECLDSLAAQTLAEFEVVAVDDRSRDGSRARLERRAGADSRIRVVEAPAAGLVAALNAGLAACRAPLVARMDADDRAHPRRLELQAERFRSEPGLEVLGTRVEHFPDEAVGEGFRIYERWLNSLLTHEEILRERFIESPLPHPSVMARTATLRRAGGYRDAGWPEDYDLWLRLAHGGARFGKVPKTLLGWRHHAGRLTTRHRRYAVERFLACKAHHLARGPLAEAHRVIVWGAGPTGRRLSKHLLREGAPLEAFVDIDRAKIGRTLRGRPIHDVEELPRLHGRDAASVVVTAVSSRAARGLIRERLAAFGLAEGLDYWCAA